MPRKPLNGQPMTAAERQRRHRARAKARTFEPFEGLGEFEIEPLPTLDELDAQLADIPSLDETIKNLPDFDDLGDPFSLAGRLDPPVQPVPMMHPTRRKYSEGPGITWVKQTTLAFTVGQVLFAVPYRQIAVRGGRIYEANEAGEIVCGDPGDIEELIGRGCRVKR